MNILYEDNHIIVVYKEEGILSQADSSDTNDMVNMLKNYIKEKYNKPGNVFVGLVHRLDRNTSGIMVLAKTSKAASRLFEAMSNNQFHKKYIALVEGKIEVGKKEKLIDYLEKDEKNNKSFISKKGKEAILEYESIKNITLNNYDYTFIDINLYTGRHHQIRCQMSNIGHPLYGDTKYNARKQKDSYLALQSYYLSFKHPTKDEIMEFKYINHDNVFSYLNEKI